ncbi:hypothetical protein BDR26DRAFT_864624 [Obelidium mucronatum]|nr:hypothetical protein BDR26DRAFT_864624 [Obelidium mucronatum]
MPIIEEAVPKTTKKRSPVSYVFRLSFFLLAGLFTSATLSLLLVLALPLALVYPPAFRFFARQSVKAMASLAAIVSYVLIRNVEIVVTGDSTPSFRQLWFCNHQTFLDWWFLGLYAWHQGSIDGLTIILMDMLKYIPFAGWLAWFAGFIFLKQKWALDQAKFKRSLTAIAKRRKDPLLLLIFPEGLLVHPKNLNSAKEFLEKQRLEARPDTYIPKDPKHVILPRSKGLRTCIQQLCPVSSSASESGESQDGIDALVDVTLGYWPSSRGFETGIYPHDAVTPFSVFGEGTEALLTRVCLDFRNVSATTNFLTLNQMSDGEFDGWLKKRWEFKDDLMGYFHENGRFGGFESNGEIEEVGTTGSVDPTIVVRIVPRLMDYVRVLSCFLALWSIVAGATVLGVYVRLQ